MQPRLTGFQIDLLPGSGYHSLFEIDDAVLAEPWDRLAGMRIERDQPVPRGDKEDAVVALSVRPIGHAPAGELPWRNGGAIPFTETVHPHLLTGLGVQRDHGPPRSGGGV